MSKAVGRSVPEPGDGKRGEVGYLGYLLRQAASAYRLRQDRALADLGVTQPQFVVMTMLKAYPGQSNADLARVALLTPQTTSVIVANLERAGLIERHPHEVHGRIQRVELTLSGRSLLKICRSRVRSLEGEIVGGLDDDHIGTIRRWLSGVARLNVV